LNISLALVGMFLGPYSDRWYLTPCREEGNHYDTHTQHVQGRIYLHGHQMNSKTSKL
jgi:hypothetical protein